MSTIHVYTDGICNMQKRIGGWAVVSEDFTYNGCHEAENGIDMELYSVWKAMEYTHDYDRVHIYTDSQEVVDIFTSKSYMWEQDDWKWYYDNGKERTIHNLEMIKKIFYEMSTNPKYVFHKVRGHNGVELNEEADKYAKKSYRFKKWMKKKNC